MSMTMSNIKVLENSQGLVDTNFIGSTTGTIVDDGKTYTATVNTKPFREACKV